MEAQFIDDGVLIDYTPDSACDAGQVVQLTDGRAAVCVGDIAASTLGAVRVKGIFDLESASATTFAVGAVVFWDVSADVAINQSSAGIDDIYVGRCAVAKVNGDLVVRTELNADLNPQAEPIIQSLVYEFDCETGVDTGLHTLIPAGWNNTGLLILACYGIVSEVFAGTQDQGIVTIADSAGSPNTLATLTPSDAGADSLGDVIVGTGKVLGGTTGDAVKTVAAGLGVTGQVTQVTTGSAAGKMKVRVIAARLL